MKTFLMEDSVCQYGALVLLVLVLLIIIMLIVIVRSVVRASELHKSTINRKIFGVCGGVAETLKIDPSVVRAIWVLLFLAAGYGIGLYIILAIICTNRKVEKRESFFRKN